MTLKKRTQNLTLNILVFCEIDLSVYKASILLQRRQRKQKGHAGNKTKAKVIFFLILFVCYQEVLDRFTKRFRSECLRLPWDCLASRLQEGAKVSHQGTWLAEDEAVGSQKLKCDVIMWFMLPEGPPAEENKSNSSVSGPTSTAEALSEHSSESTTWNWCAARRSAAAGSFTLIGSFCFTKVNQIPQF